MMDVFNGPSSNGLNLLNNGIITVGTTYWIIKRNSVLAIQHRIHPVVPAASKNQKMIDKRIPPMSIERPIVLKKSEIKRMGVVLLNPNLSSITNVEYILKGKEIISFKPIKMPTKKSPDIIGPYPNERTRPSI